MDGAGDLSQAAFTGQTQGFGFEGRIVFMAFVGLIHREEKYCPTLSRSARPLNLTFNRPSNWEDLTSGLPFANNWFIERRSG
jgi:hypothetical protein